MKKFFLHIILLSFVLMSTLMVCWCSLCKIINYNATFYIEDSVKYVVLGSSHSACSFDEKFIKYLQNYSRSGEAYCYTYAKLKCLLANNRQIDTIFIEFSNPFIYDNDEWLWSSKYLRYHYITLAPFLSFRDHYYLFKNHILSWCQTIPFFIRDATKKIKKRNFDFSQYGSHETVNGIIDTTSKQSKINIEHLNVQLYFLDKIVDLCKFYRVKLIFVRSPLFPTFKYWETEVDFQNIRNKRYGEVPFWDFGHFMSEPYYFRDFQHLNQDGSEKFSIHFNSLINK